MPDPAVRPGRHLAGGPPRQPWDVLADALAAERAEAAARVEAAECAEAGETEGVGNAEPPGRASRLRSDLFDRLPARGQRVAVELGQHWWLPVVAALVALALTIAVAVRARPVAEALPSAGRPGTATSGTATSGTATSTAPTSTVPTAPGSATGSAAGVAPGAAPSMSLPATPPASTGPGATPLAASAPAVPAVVVVDVAGRVRHPGVVQLVAGSRIVDAIRAAGGALPHTDLTPLDLAQPLSDGEQVRVGLPGVALVAPTATSGTGSGAGSGTGGTAAPAATTGPVDLNTATAEGLDALPGIGPVLAARIIAWRAAHGPFDSVDDLVDVPGIGPTILGALRPLVSVGP